MDGDEKNECSSKPGNADKDSNAHGENYEPVAKSSRLDDREASTSSARTLGLPAHTPHMIDGDVPREKVDKPNRIGKPEGGLFNQSERKRAYRFRLRHYRTTYSSASSDDDQELTNTSIIENSENPGNPENLENTGNTENPGNSENPENPENLENETNSENPGASDESSHSNFNPAEVSYESSLSHTAVFSRNSSLSPFLYQNSSSCETGIGGQIADILNRPTPMQNFCLPRSIIFRHHGLNILNQRIINDSSTTSFRNQIYASVNTVKYMKILHNLYSHRGCVNSINFNQAGNLLVSGSDDLHLIVWKWASKKIQLKYHTGHQQNVFQTKFVENGMNDNGMNIVTSSRDGEVRLIQAKPDGSVVSRILYSHCGGVNKITLPSTNPGQILSVAGDGTVVRYDFRDNLRELIIHFKKAEQTVPLYSIDSHPFDPEFCISGADKTVQVYDSRKFTEPVRSFVPCEWNSHSPEVHITSSVYNYNGTEILASYTNDKIYLFENKDCTLGTFLHSYAGHKNSNTIKSVNFYGPHSEYIISGSDCGNLFMWERNTQSIVHWSTADDEGVVNCLEPHSSFPIIATSGLDQDVKIWAPNSYKNTISPEKLKTCVSRNVASRMIQELNLDSLEHVVATWARRYDSDFDNLNDTSNSTDESSESEDENTDFEETDTDDFMHGGPVDECTTS